MVGASSPSHRGGVAAFKLAALYPYYDAVPEYFDNVQVTKAEQGAAGWVYEFAVSISYADNPKLLVDVNVQVVDQDGAQLCDPVDAEVDQTSNHILVSNCDSAEKVEKAVVVIRAKLSVEDDLMKIREYEFDLTKI